MLFLKGILFDNTTERSYNNDSKEVKYMTKQDIFEATLVLACEKGLGSISMQQIADRVNLKKSSLYSHFKSKDEIIDGMYLYFRDKAKEQTGNRDVDYGKLVEGRTLYEILSGVVSSYRTMNSTSDMNKFYRLIMAERTINPVAAQVMVEETNKMVAATKNLFYAISAKGISHFDNPDAAAIIFAMSVHSILDFEFDCINVGTSDAEGVMEKFITEFCSIYGGK